VILTIHGLLMFLFNSHRHLTGVVRVAIDLDLFPFTRIQAKK
jgi:hypothetical protein